MLITALTVITGLLSFPYSLDRVTVFFTHTIDLYRAIINSIVYSSYSLYSNDGLLMSACFIQDPFLHMFCHTLFIIIIHDIVLLDNSYTITIGPWSHRWTHFKVLGEIGRGTSGLG